MEERCDDRHIYLKVGSRVFEEDRRRVSRSGEVESDFVESMYLLEVVARVSDDDRVVEEICCDLYLHDHHQACNYLHLDHRENSGRDRET